MRNDFVINEFQECVLSERSLWQAALVRSGGFMGAAWLREEGLDGRHRLAAGIETPGTAAVHVSDAFLQDCNGAHR